MPRGQSGKRTQHIQAQLNWDYETEAQALTIFETLREKGYSARQIITDAMFKYDGSVPEYYEESGTALQRLQRIEDKIDFFYQEMASSFVDMLEVIKRNPHTNRAIVDHLQNEDSASMDDEVTQNIIDVFKRSRGDE